MSHYQILDAKLRVEMRREIKKLHKRLKTTIVYVTHDQTEAMSLGTNMQSWIKEKFNNVILQKIFITNQEYVCCRFYRITFNEFNRRNI